jgi:hypothetical protein
MQPLLILFEKGLMASRYPLSATSRLPYKNLSFRHPFLDPGQSVLITDTSYPVWQTGRRLGRADLSDLPAAADQFPLFALRPAETKKESRKEKNTF